MKSVLKGNAGAAHSPRHRLHWRNHCMLFNALHYDVTLSCPALHWVSGLPCIALGCTLDMPRFVTWCIALHFYPGTGCTDKTIALNCTELQLCSLDMPRFVTLCTGLNRVAHWMICTLNGPRFVIKCIALQFYQLHLRDQRALDVHFLFQLNVFLNFIFCISAKTKRERGVWGMGSKKGKLLMRLSEGGYMYFYMH